MKRSEFLKLLMDAVEVVNTPVGPLGDNSLNWDAARQMLKYHDSRGKVANALAYFAGNAGTPVKNFLAAEWLLEAAWEEFQVGEEFRAQEQAVTT